MTSPHSVSAERSASPLGTLTIVPWTNGPTPDDSIVPFLMVYSLGDGRDGPEAGEAAMRAALEGMGLPIGDRVVNAAQETAIAAHLLVEAQQAVLTLPFMKVQCSVPAQWEKAAHENAQVFLIVSTLPWPDAVPGEAITEEQLRAFVTDEKVVTAGAHVMLPVRRVRG
ncbi:DUF5949 family protein [Streptomyces purpureus]|uniref:Uncharacterized protein n=1 Tax=Streptomyces purpureus TaxID=1951 RepID=A0A918HCZ7_9ACTN|nr:DUF5949 family protein [Streptomyces purpureus]GGT52800.1 hypothetical protein GCM10014713_53430 [Streptomyces purpureus]